MNENDLSSAINKLLADPEALSGIMQMASGLMGNMANDKPRQVSTDENNGQYQIPEGMMVKSESTLPEGSQSPTGVPLQGSEKDQSSVSLPDITGLLGLLGASGKRDPKCELLNALRPFMSTPRKERIDQLVRLLQIADTAGRFLSGGKTERE